MPRYSAAEYQTALRNSRNDDDDGRYVDAENIVHGLLMAHARVGCKDAVNLLTTTNEPPRFAQWFKQRNADLYYNGTWVVAFPTPGYTRPM